MNLANILNRPSTPSPTPPSTPPPSNYTIRDQRLQTQTLHEVGFTCNQIREQLGLTLNQVRYAVSHRLTPQKRKGRPSKLTQEEVDEIIAWICTLKTNRRTP